MYGVVGKCHLSTLRWRVHAGEYYYRCTALIRNLSDRADANPPTRNDAYSYPNRSKPNRQDMKNKFTPEDMQTLAQWEHNMRTAIQSNYLRNVGRAAVKTISDIRARQLGVKEVYVNDSCASCILDLLQRVGKDYFEQKEDYAQKPSGELKTPGEVESPKTLGGTKNPRALEITYCLTLEHKTQ